MPSTTAKKPRAANLPGVPPAKWKWYGTAGHLCVASQCRFHLNTEIGRYLVSTIGDYWPRGATERQEIGSGRMLETMVFELNGNLCPCGCGMPDDYTDNEVDSDGYNSFKAAGEGHYAMCEKWSRIP